MKTQLMNHFFAALIAILLAGSSARSSGADAAVPMRVPDEREKPPTLTVNGDGEIAAAPDRATVRLGATAQAEDAAGAQTSVNATMQKALEGIQRAGIPRQSIRTTGLTLTPVYAPQKPERVETPRVVAYRAANTIEVTVDDLKLVGAVIDAGVTAGANRLEGVSFRLQDDLPQRTRALTAAVDEAKLKAEAIARALRVRIVKVAEVIEGGVHIMPRQESFAGARAFTADAMRTPVEPGEVRVRASVTIRYEIDSR